MKISLDKISKRFQRHLIFRDIQYQFSAPGNYALLGNNGSGKSTLMRIVAGIQNPSSGTVVYEDGGAELTKQQLYKYISYSAPGMELVEEFTLREFFSFHFKFKSILPGLNEEDVLQLTGLQKAAHKQVSDFSSGMKQRVKLAQAIFSDTPVLLLDEPCTNLDNEGVKQYQDWIAKYTANRLVIVASNDEREYFFCEDRLHVAYFAK